MKELDRVLAEPGSKAARSALAAAWRAANETDRADLIDKQLELFELQQVQGDFISARSEQLEAEVKQLVAKRGREFAGRVAELASGYEFRRGLVGEVTVTADAWPKVARELFALAPIQHVNITGPIGDLAAVLAVPEIARLVSLSFARDGIGDRGATELARTAALANLRWLDLFKNDIGDAGVEAIAASPFFEKCAFIAFTLNPCDPTPMYSAPDGIGGRPPKAAELEKTFGPRPWLAIPDRDTPDRDVFAIKP